MRNENAKVYALTENDTPRRVTAMLSSQTVRQPLGTSNVVIDLRDGCPSKVLVKFENQQSEKDQRKLEEVVNIPISQLATESSYHRHEHDTPNQRLA
jgi:hypothetical protein